MQLIKQYLNYMYLYVYIRLCLAMIVQCYVLCDMYALFICIILMHSWEIRVDPVVVQSLSRFRLFATPWTAARQASLCITNSQSILKLMSIESVMPSNHLTLCLPLLLLPSVFSQHQGLFKWVSSLHQVVKVMQLQLQQQQF